MHRTQAVFLRGRHERCSQGTPQLLLAHLTCKRCWHCTGICTYRNQRPGVWQGLGLGSGAWRVDVGWLCTALSPPPTTAREMRRSWICGGYRNLPQQVDLQRIIPDCEQTARTLQAAIATAGIGALPFHAGRDQPVLPTACREYRLLTDVYRAYIVCCVLGPAGAAIPIEHSWKGKLATSVSGMVCCGQVLVLEGAVHPRRGCAPLQTSVLTRSHWSCGGMHSSH
jgi:hypothetical protein